MAGHQCTHGRCEWFPLNHMICFILSSSPLLIKLSQPTSFLPFALFYCLHHPMERIEWVSGCVVLSWQVDQLIRNVISCACSFWCILTIILLSNFKALYYTTLRTQKRKDTYCKCHSDNGNSPLPRKMHRRYLSCWTAEWNFY